MTGSEIYHRMMKFFEEHPEYDPELQRRCWEATPWITEVYVGDPDNRREMDMRLWCWERWGEPANPFRDPPTPGQWREGNAIVYGWAYWGFATEQQMREFEAAWPPPEGIKR